MREPEKYCGVIPAFYACYDDAGEVSPERVRALAEHLIRKGVKGVYVGGSSGECIYQSVDDRKRTLENVMAVAKGRITVIAHVACNNTRDSVELARHAESLGVDAIAAIPPIYFHLPEYAIADYWNAMSNAAPNTDFVIYNIPQLAGVALTMPLFEEMRKNPRVAAVKILPCRCRISRCSRLRAARASWCSTVPMNSLWAGARWVRTAVSAAPMQ